MSRSIFQPEWRTQSRRKRRFYARYMGWLEKTGFTIVSLLLASFVGSFFYEIDEWVSAEEVAIEAEEAVVPMPAGTTIVQIGHSGDQVQKGDLIAESWSSNSPSKLLQEIRAPISGELNFTGGSKKVLPPDSPLAVVRNYGRLVVRPKLAGKSIAKAAAGQPAELTNIRIQNEGDTLLRVSLEGGDTAVSRRLAGTAVKDALQEALKGRSIVVRDDIPLQIAGVVDVEVETQLKTTASRNPGLSFDPQPEFKLEGKVIEGKHVLSAQLGDLPADVRRHAIEALRKHLVGDDVEFAGGSRRIEDLVDPRFVVRLNAENKGDAAPAIQAASLKRSFEATIALSKVPPDLVERIREAHRQGKQVTAKVQVRTGSKPIAYFLLRRS